jgi:molecular chaperone HtpG
MEKGQISVQTDNIFPIIKKFLYSDQEIFLRELVSNAVDATAKVQTLSRKGELDGELGELKIEILLDKEAGTLTIRDRGIGMSEEEVKKYLNQVAFSSAQEFLEKYKDDAQIIGHFGLGFYSAFMVAQKVEVVTKSHQKDSKGVTWTCEGDPAYTIEENDKKDRGTNIILYVSEDSQEFLEESRIGDLLNKYCKFLPIPIQFGTRKETIEEGEGDDKQSKEVEVDNIINNSHPAWKKNPGDLSEQDYKDFYNELYPFSPAPLFWIHLNIDFPFNLTGILYFPKLNNGLELQKNKIQLYSNQVYVTDDVKEIVPEFLTLLHGVIDSPDIPLNVSRSYLQSDSNVRKITGYITKKVAEKLHDLFKSDRKDFEQKWEDLGVFIKYGMMSDDKFHDRAEKFTLLKNAKGEHFTLEEYRSKVKDQQTNKNDKIVLLYTHHATDHHHLIEEAEAQGYDVLEFNNPIDNHFLQHLEYKMQDVSFARIDSDTLDHLIEKDETKESVLSEEEQTTVKTLFEGLTEAAPGATVTLKPLSPESQPVQVVKPEFMRRMKEMQSLQGAGMDFPESFNVIVNSNHPLIASRLLKMEEDSSKEEFARYLYDLALLNQQMLRGPELTRFIKRSMNFLAEEK